MKWKKKTEKRKLEHATKNADNDWRRKMTGNKKINDIYALRKKEMNKLMGSPVNSYAELVEIDEMMKKVDEIVEMHANDPKRGRTK